MVGFEAFIKGAPEGLARQMMHVLGAQRLRLSIIGIRNSSHENEKGIADTKKIGSSPKGVACVSTIHLCLRHCGQKDL